MARFIHTSDVHLAKPFGRFDQETGALLRYARMAVFETIAKAAQKNDAPIVVLAGDTFDTEVPSGKTTSSAMEAMASAADVTWILMPGNHDSLAATDLWDRINADRPDNVRLALEPIPIEIGEDLAILPAPPTVRDPGRDLTEWMSRAETGQRIRIGLAHGGIQDFGSEEGASAVIPPDRAKLSDLDYLALGDWHGRKEIGARTWYSGTPESDSFKGHEYPGCLLIEVDGRGAAPRVTPIRTGTFGWHAIDLDLRPGDDPASELAARLPESDRRNALVSLSVDGRLTLSEHQAMTAALAAVRDDFLHFEEDLGWLEIEQEPGDLDEIDKAGALRTAADSLFEKANDPDLDEESRRVSRMALLRLYQFARESDRS